MDLAEAVLLAELSPQRAHPTVIKPPRPHVSQYKVS